MPYYASFPVFTAIPEAKDTKDEYGNHPMATGPVHVRGFKPGSELTLVKNDQLGRPRPTRLAPGRRRVGLHLR